MPEFKPCNTVKELKEAIKDLPDDMIVGTWDGDNDMFYSWVNAVPTTMYYRNGLWSPYGGYDEDNLEPTQTMLSL